jgi:methionyl-tRNA formyltransferase
MIQRPHVVFLGTSSFAIPALTAISKFATILDVITQPDALAHRGLKTTTSPIKTKAEAFGLHVATPDRLNDQQLIERIASLKPDVGIMVAYGKIVPKKFITIFPYGILNLHPSLLPKYRGPSPIVAALLASDEQTGATLMLIDEELDHGPIIAKQSTTIVRNEYRSELENRLATIGATLLMDNLFPYLNGTLRPVPQNHKEATFTKLLKRTDGILDWKDSAEAIATKIRALQPWPGTFTSCNSKQLKILRAHAVSIPSSQSLPGTVIAYQGFIAVLCGRGALVLEEVQYAGKRPCSGNAFSRGHAAFIGSILKSL